MPKERAQSPFLSGILDGGGTKLSINQAHSNLGHIGEDAVQKIAGHLGWHLTQGMITACELCAVGKAHHQNLGHCSEVMVSMHPMCVHFDISSIKKLESVSHIHKPHLQIIVIDAMQLKFVHFFETKDGMVEPPCKLFSRWKQSGHMVDIVWLDNARENMLLQNQATVQHASCVLTFSLWRVTPLS